MISRIITMIRIPIMGGMTKKGSTTHPRWSNYHEVHPASGPRRPVSEPGRRDQRCPCRCTEGTWGLHWNSWLGDPQQGPYGASWTHGWSVHQFGRRDSISVVRFDFWISAGKGGQSFNGIFLKPSFWCFERVHNRRWSSESTVRVGKLS